MWLTQVALWIHDLQGQTMLRAEKNHGWKHAVVIVTKRTNA
jgi:hypothetical protein